MSTKPFLGLLALTVIFYAPVASSQQKPPASGAQEFPILMHQNIVAGKTPVGSSVEATLMLATLIGGKVVPEGATFSGVVVESAAKSPTAPSRLSVRMESVRWKKGSEPIKAYLTAWYYPSSSLPPDSSADGPTGANGEGKRTWAAYNPNPTDRVLFPGRTPDRLPEPPSPSSSDNAEHHVAMKNVDSVRDNDAAIVLTSTKSNLKFDKSTTYVLVAGDLTTGK
jgi:hypothetical protein